MLLSLLPKEDKIYFIELVKQLMQEYNISSRLTFSNSLIELFHLKDVRCNEVCEKFNNSKVKNMLTKGAIGSLLRISSTIVSGPFE